MTRFLSTLFGSKSTKAIRKIARTARRRKPALGVERLGDRILPTINLTNALFNLTAGGDAEQLSIQSWNATTGQAWGWFSSAGTGAEGMLDGTIRQATQNGQPAADLSLSASGDDTGHDGTGWNVGNIVVTGRVTGPGTNGAHYGTDQFAGNVQAVNGTRTVNAAATGNDLSPLPDLRNAHFTLSGGWHAIQLTIESWNATSGGVSGWFEDQASGASGPVAGQARLAPPQNGQPAADISLSGGDNLGRDGNGWNIGHVAITGRVIGPGTNGAPFGTDVFSGTMQDSGPTGAVNAPATGNDSGPIPDLGNAHFTLSAGGHTEQLTVLTEDRATGAMSASFSDPTTGAAGTLRGQVSHPTALQNDQPVSSINLSGDDPVGHGHIDVRGQVTGPGTGGSLWGTDQFSGFVTDSGPRGSVFASGTGNDLGPIPDLRNAHFTLTAGGHTEQLAIRSENLTTGALTAVFNDRVTGASGSLTGQVKPATSSDNGQPVADIQFTTDTPGVSLYVSVTGRVTGSGPNGAPYGNDRFAGYLDDRGPNGRVTTTGTGDDSAPLLDLRNAHFTLFAGTVTEQVTIVSENTTTGALSASFTDSATGRSGTLTGQVNRATTTQNDLPVCDFSLASSGGTTPQLTVRGKVVGLGTGGSAYGSDLFYGSVTLQPAAGGPVGSDHSFGTDESVRSSARTSSGTTDLLTNSDVLERWDDAAHTWNVLGTGVQSFREEPHYQNELVALFGGTWKEWNGRAWNPVSAIRLRYETLNGPAGMLGTPVTDETPAGDGVGTRQEFDHGGDRYTMMWSPATGAKLLHGAIRLKYDAVGGPGVLGYPSTDETAVGDGVGIRQDFVKGSDVSTVIWSPATGAQVLHGAIRDKFLYLGNPSRARGYPVESEHAAADGVGSYQSLERGGIYWSPYSGAFLLSGAILDRWAQLGYGRGGLGYPVSDETATPDGVGRYNDFWHGSVYWTSGTGAHAVLGAIRDDWAGLGRERSGLGYPVAEEAGTPDGKGRFTRFQNGSIYSTHDTGAHAVVGAIYDRWAALGWERGSLGYPISDDAATPDGSSRYTNFQGGAIYWSSATGARDFQGFDGFVPYSGRLNVVAANSAVVYQSNDLVHTAFEGAWGLARNLVHDVIVSYLGSTQFVGQHLYDIDLNLASSGDLYFANTPDGPAVGLLLRGNELVATSTQPTPLGRWADPRFRVRFDVAIEIGLSGQGLLQAQSAKVKVVNAHIDPVNVVANVLSFFNDISRFFGGPDFRGMLENRLDHMSLTQNLSGFTDSINAILGSLLPQVQNGLRLYVDPLGDRMTIRLPV